MYNRNASKTDVRITTGIDIMNDYGHIEIQLAEIIQKKGLKRYNLANKADMNWKQVDNYYHNTITRLDTDVLSKLCYTLGCEIQDLLVYVPPTPEKDT